MLSFLKSRLLRPGKVCGVEIVLLPEGGPFIHATVVRLKDNKIVKEKEALFVGSMEELAKKIPVDLPLALTINGKGVLHKKITGPARKEKRFDVLLPNANPHDFYLQVLPCRDFDSATIVRRDIVDRLLKELKEQGFKVIAVDCGPGNMSNLIPWINGPASSLIGAGFAIRFDGQKEVLDIEVIAVDSEQWREEQEYNIGEQYIKASGLTAFGTAIGLIAEGIEGENRLNAPAVAAERDEYRYFRYFRAAGLALLSAVFVILLISFLVYNHYFEKNAGLQASRVVFQDQAAETHRLRAAVKDKEGLIHQYGWDKPSRLSYYADRIGGLVPGTTVLTDMKLFPVSTAVSGDEWRFKKDTIQVAGTCEDPTELNRFANNLKNIREFREVNIKSYLYSKDNGSGVFLMEIVTL